MNTRGDSARQAYPLFQTGDGGSQPTSPLQLRFSTIGTERAKDLNRLWHSRFPNFGGGNTRVCYSAEHDGLFYAVAMWTNPSSRKLPQRKWLMLKRYAIANDAPKNTASRMEGWMVRDIRKRFPEVVMLVSYSDPDAHEGTIYRACGWTEGETTKRKPAMWNSRDRDKVTNNEACHRVTRWTKAVSNVGY